MKQVEPQYPPAAKKKGEQGTVRISAVIGKDGRPKDVEVLHSPAPDLAASAVGAVKQFLYAPYSFNGAPVEEPIQINISFRRD